MLRTGGGKKAKSGDRENLDDGRSQKNIRGQSCARKVGKSDGGEGGGRGGGGEGPKEKEIKVGRIPEKKRRKGEQIYLWPKHTKSGVFIEGEKKGRIVEKGLKIMSEERHGEPWGRRDSGKEGD